MLTSKEKAQLIALGSVIKARRFELGLSQEAFAERSNLHRTYISGIEQGRRNVAFLNLIQIARALDLTPQELIEKISIYFPNEESKSKDDKNES